MLILSIEPKCDCPAPNSQKEIFVPLCESALKRTYPSRPESTPDQPAPRAFFSTYPNRQPEDCKRTECESKLVNP